MFLSIEFFTEMLSEIIFYFRFQSALSNVKPETIPLFMSDCIDGLLVLNEVELEALRHGLMDLKVDWFDIKENVLEKHTENNYIH